MNLSASSSRLLGALALFITPAAFAASVSWDGDANDGLWSSPTNWSNDSVPGSGDTVTVNDAAVTWDITANNGTYDPSTLDLTGTSTLTINGVFRANGASVTVGSEASLAASGNTVFYDWNNGSVTFEAGAQFTNGVWENKGTNQFTFNLDANGFETLTPSFVNISGANFLTTTYTVDLGAYTGSTGTITLVDFGGEFGDNLTNATFQTSTHQILNAGSFAGSTLSYADANDAILLNIVPEPSSALLTVVGLGFCLLRRRS